MEWKIMAWERPGSGSAPEVPSSLVSLRIVFADRRKHLFIVKHVLHILD
jgi:hypothetical protein